MIDLDDDSKGTVFWITGLSGAGKTTVAHLLYQELKKKHKNLVMLDGDKLREAIGGDLGHELKDRQQIAFRNSKLCKLLSDQGLHVICATIAMFENCRQWNRQHIENYVEVYLKVPMDVLMERDPKQIYLKYKNGEIKNVVGLDMPFEAPLAPTLTIENYGQLSPQQSVELIKQNLCL